MDIIDLKSREVFSHEGRGVAALVEEDNLQIRQIGLEPGKEVPVHTADARVTLQVVRGQGTFTIGKENVRMGPGKLLRVPEGASMGIRNDSANPLVFLVIKTPAPSGPGRKSMLVGEPGSFVNFIDFAPLKPEKEQAFHDWFRRSSEAFAKHPGFISRTLLGPIEGGHRYAAVVEFESKETFMDMHLSDDRVEMFRQGEPLIVGSSTPQFYQSLLIHRKRGK